MDKLNLRNKIKSEHAHPVFVAVEDYTDALGEIEAHSDYPAVDSNISIKPKWRELSVFHYKAPIAEATISKVHPSEVIVDFGSYRDRLVVKKLLGESLTWEERYHLDSLNRMIEPYLEVNDLVIEVKKKRKENKDFKNLLRKMGG